MGTTQATIGSLGDPYADGTPRLEIKIDARLAATEPFVKPEQTAVVLRIDGKDYLGSVLANKPEHKTVWISPTIKTLNGEKSSLGEVLTNAGFNVNERVHLSAFSQVIIEIQRLT